MKYLLNTCLISELTKKTPNENVVDWLNSINMEDIYISVLTLGKILKGVSKLTDSKKKDRINSWFQTSVIEKFKNNIVNINDDIAIKWGLIEAESETAGQKIPVIDGLIAASALVHDLIVVTRNITDIEKSGCKILNPWQEI